MGCDATHDATCRCDWELVYYRNVLTIFALSYPFVSFANGEHLKLLETDLANINLSTKHNTDSQEPTNTFLVSLCPAELVVYYLLASLA